MNTIGSYELNQTIYTVTYVERIRQQIIFSRCINNSHRARIQVICILKANHHQTVSKLQLHHPYNVKKGIVCCQQHWAKAVSSDSNAYQEEMKSLWDNLNRNNNSESLTSASRNLDWTTESDTWKLTMICLPYVNGLAKKIQNICHPYDIRTIVKSSTTLWRDLFQIKPLTEYNMTKNFMYSDPCWCGIVYKGETCHPLKVRLEDIKRQYVMWGV